MTPVRDDGGRSIEANDMTSEKDDDFLSEMGELDTDEADTPIVKAFLGRTARTTVSAANIAKSLVSRVGVLDSEFVASDLSSVNVRGYTIRERQTLRNAISALAQVYKFDIIESDGVVKYHNRGSASLLTVPSAHLGDLSEEGWCEENQDNDITRVRKLNLTYRDLNREYETNVQTTALPKYTRTSFDDDSGVEVQVPVVLTASEAKALSETLLYAKAIYNRTFRIKLPQRYSHLDPGDVITVNVSDTETVVMRIRTASIGSDRSVEIEATFEDPAIYSGAGTLFGDTGRFGGSELPATGGRVEPFFMSLPFMNYASATNYDGQHAFLFTLLNYTAGAPLPTVPLDISLGNANAVETTKADAPTLFPTWGFVIDPLQFTGAPFATDKKSVLKVRVMSTSDGVPTSAASLEAMIDNSQINLALVGNELIQFRTVTSLGGGVYEFRVINRGLFGTEQYFDRHVRGEVFILLGSSTGVLSTGAVFGVLKNTDYTPNRLAQVTIPDASLIQPRPFFLATALNMRAFAPSDFRTEYSGADLVATWSHRTRLGDAGAELTDGATEVLPISEETETYTIYITDNAENFAAVDAATYLRTTTVTSPTFTYTSAMASADGYNPATDNLYFIIGQDGSISEFDRGRLGVFKVLAKP
jgi:hypothetical protein